ncbi:hypothetical protein VTK56DRAFT_5641 [Thermocarpiscus australiensis]
MFGNETASAVSVLQKTYDESYLTCSTAVFYESQGNEGEAMRCWKQALEQIYDHHANRVFPNFTPRSESEKALVDSLRQLELQCKERIDLLEALRLSRQEALRNDSSSSGSKASQATSESRDAGLSRQQDQGWIGHGTVPAVTYAELSRPDGIRRHSTRSRSLSSQHAAVKGSGRQEDDIASHSPSRKPLAATASLPSPEKKTQRAASSPERHTMRSTLRTRQPGEKSTKRAQKGSTSKPAEGPGASEAAILAWSSQTPREATDQELGNNQGFLRATSSPPAQSEQPRRSFEALNKQLDSRPNRLTTPRMRSPVKLSDRRVSADPAALRRHDGYYSPRPRPISVSAASTALSSLALRDPIERRRPTEEDLVQRQWQKEQLITRMTASMQTPQTRMPGDISNTDQGMTLGGETKLLRGKTPSDPAKILGVSSSNASSAIKSKSTTTTPSGKSTGTSRAGGGRRETRLERTTSLSSDISSSSFETPVKPSRKRRSKERQNEASLVVNSVIQFSDSSTEDDETKVANTWKKRKAEALKKLPPGVDMAAAKQILNEIVVQGDEVHWGDIAGLEVAKNALRETVVYPFLRPDLFMGLREPARGMLLFGPPGTGKTMLARAVATESKSTFFSISASSLTSKYLGESEKLVRALFALAKLLAPSIIFVDEIDSLLSQRSGSGEHEATRRIKTEFLIQWSDLQRAAAGREATPAGKDKDRGDANRVLVLAATNLPWAIDEAARRRFVRRQYIPLPEAETRAVHLKTLLKQQKHNLTDADIDTLVGLTDGFSGSDITALAKDAAMGPLRSLGEALLHMTMDEIRPIELSDFVASLGTIRPSVSKASLKEYEDWAKEFGERGG